MSAEHDRQFVRTFMIVLGALVAFTFVIIFVANMIADRTQGVYIDENPLKNQSTTAVQSTPAVTAAGSVRSSPG